MKLRTMRADDVESVAELSTELGYPSTASQIAHRFERLAAANGEYVLVAEDDGGVIGWTHVRAIASLESDPHAEVWGLVVSEAARSRGVGTALLAECERWARSCGFASIRLRSNVIRTRAHRLYQRLGYRVVKKQKVFEKQLSLISSRWPVQETEN